IGIWLVVLAALAAFASAVNAGILAAARYPMAMARDGLLPAKLGGLSRHATPAVGVVITGAMIAVVVLAFDAESIAKLASAFVLLTLGMVNLAVLVLRASRIRSYAPAFRTPFYPFTQFAGIAVSVLLISMLGLMALVFIGVVTAVAWVWHHFYATPRTQRAGAIRHVFERWGEGVDRGLDREMSAAMAGHGLRSDDDYAGLIARAAVLSVSSGTDIAEAAERVSTVLSDRIGLQREIVSQRFLETGSLWIQPSDDHPTATPVALFDAIHDDQLVIVRAADGIRIPAAWGGSGERVNALFFLAGTSTNPGRSLRLAGELAGYLHGGARLIGSAGTEAEVKSALLPGVTLRQYALLPEGRDVGLIGERVGDIEWLDGVELASVTRFGVSLTIDPDLVLEPDDQLALLGPDSVMPAAGQPAPLRPARS
ncbi:MAG: amino acid permease, partial [Acidimicrobiales bacterium]|nr:amino acid permease [Acidimicrobiales bacterium]